MIGNVTMNFAVRNRPAEEAMTSVLDSHGARRIVQVVVSEEDSATVALASVTFAPLLGAMQCRPIKTWIAEWHRRARERSELIKLCERDRRDIRISRANV
jgi:uncharacterized protein YjiS (DUF1127 family)